MNQQQQNMSGVVSRLINRGLSAAFEMQQQQQQSMSGALERVLKIEHCLEHLRHGSQLQQRASEKAQHCRRDWCD